MREEGRWRTEEGEGERGREDRGQGWERERG